MSTTVPVKVNNTTLLSNFAQPLIALTASEVAAQTGQNNATAFPGDIGDPLQSADNRYLVFDSTAENLITPDATGYIIGANEVTGSDVFRLDRSSGAIVRVDESTAGVQANGFALAQSVSADGRYVTFYSNADNLVAGDTVSHQGPNGFRSTYLYAKDLDTKALIRITGDGASNSFVAAAQIHTDARKIGKIEYLTGAYVTNDVTQTNTRILTDHDISIVTANDSLIGDAGPSLYLFRATADAKFVFVYTGDYIYRKDMTNGDLLQVNGGGDASYEANSADGNYVYFTRGQGASSQLYAENMTTGAVKVVSASASGVVADHYADTSDSNLPNFVSASADGRYVVFRANADNLVPGDTNHEAGNNHTGDDAFVKDLQTGAITRLSVGAHGEQFTNFVGGDGSTRYSPVILPTLSPDGHTALVETPVVDMLTGGNRPTIGADYLYSLDLLYPVPFVAQKATADKPVGAGPRALATGDIDGDGKVDIVTADSAAGTLTVLMGQGDGSFVKKAALTLAGGPAGIVLADVNGDGKLDALTANYDGDSVSVLLGNGNGTFKAATTLAVGHNPYEVTVADVNGDGKLDLLAANSGAYTVSLLLGNGDGTFKPQTQITRDTSPGYVAAGDLNGDGRLDLVTTNYNSGSITTLIGQANGSFSTGQSFLTGANPVPVVLADVNGDGLLDAVVGNAQGGSVSVLLGLGNGTFQAQTTFAVGTTPVSVAVGDVNADGHPDIVATNAGSGSGSILLGEGNGVFVPQAPVTVGTTPYFVSLADVNGDGGLDLAVANRGDGSVSVLLGTAPATNAPDLAVVGVVLDKTSAQAGDVVNVSYGVRNQGGVSAGASTSTVYLSQDAAITTSDVAVGTLPDPAIAAGKTLSDTVNATLPANLAPGTYYIGIIADANHQLTNEPNTGNNTSAARAFTVTGPVVVHIGTLNETLNGPGAGAYDTLTVQGTPDLTGATLNVLTSNGYLNSIPAGTSFKIIDNDGTADAVIGTFANANASGDVLIRPAAPTYTFSQAYHVNTHGGDGNDVVITMVNTQPNLYTVPGAQSVASGSSLSFTGGNKIDVADADENSPQQLTAILSVAHGTLSTGGTATIHSGDGTGTVTILGRASHVDTTLHTLVYTPGAGYGGADTLNIVVQDDSGASNDGVNAAVAITVTGGGLSAPPTVTLGTIAADDVINRAEAGAGVAVSGTTANVADGGIVTVLLHGADGAILDRENATVSANAFSVTLPSTALNDGAATVTADVTTRAGSAPEAGRAVTIDLTSPTISLVLESATASDGHDQVQLIGFVEANAGTRVEIFDGATDLGAATITSQTTSAGHGWSFTTTYTGGSHGLHAVAMDAAGNTARACYEPVISRSACLSMRQTKATMCNPARVVA